MKTTPLLMTEIDPPWKKPFQISPENPIWDEGKPWVLEIGPGNGKFLLWLAEQHPHQLHIAIEIRNMRFQNLAKKARENRLNNIIAIHGDARHCLPFLFKGPCLDEAYILFPDPWPKRRHNKHRLLNLERTDELYELLKPGGRVWVATDHDHYSAQIQKVFPSDRWKYEEGKSFYPTYFETKWVKMGRKIHYFCFKKFT